MNAVTAVQTAATVSANIEAIFVGTKPASLTRAENAVAETRDEMAALNEQLAPYRARAWKSGTALPLSVRGLEMAVKASESKLNVARNKLAEERDAYAPRLQAALRPAHRNAGTLIAEAMAPIEQAVTILAEINRRTVLSGITLPDAKAQNLV